MAEGFVFFAAVLAQGFLCAKLLPRKYNDMEKGILVGAAEIAEIAVAANLLAVFGIFFLICAECNPVCVGGYLPLDILQAGKSTGSVRKRAGGM